MRSRLTLAVATSLSVVALQSVCAQQLPPPMPPAAPTAPAAVAPAAGTPRPAAAETGVTLPPVVVTQKKEKPAAPPVAKPAPKATADAEPAATPPARRKRPIAKAATATPAAKQVPTPAEPQAAAAEPVAEPQALAPPAGIVLAVADGYSARQGASPRDITATGGANLADALASRPGVAGSTFAPGSNRPILRGLDNARVLVADNGLASGDVSAISEDHAVPVNPCAAERIDVLHGPATLRFGGAAIGGVVASESDTIPTRVPVGGVSGEVRGGVSSVDNSRNGCFKTTAGASFGTGLGFVAHASGFDHHADDYRTPQGRQANSFVDSTGSTLGGSFVWGSGYLGLAYSRFDSLYAIPGGEAAELKKRIDMAQDRVAARGEWRPRALGIAAVRASGAWSDYNHDEIVREPGEAADKIGSRFLNKEKEGRLEIEHLPLVSPLGRHTGIAGLQVSVRDTSGLSYEGDSLLEPSDRKSVV
jgi:iron complex outermembrane receptor protein